jgi:hypothetical protein
MNNQFATQYLLEEIEDAYSSLESILRDLGTSEDAIKVLMSGVRTKNITPEGAIEIAKLTVKSVRETSTSGGGGGSTTGGGVTDGASWDPQGPTGSGEQYAEGTRKKKYQEGTFDSKEHVAIFSGIDGTANVYKKSDKTYYAQIEGEPSYDMVAKNAVEMAAKLKRDGFDLDNPVAGGLEGYTNEDAPRLAGDPSKTTKQGAKNLSAYSSVGFTKAPNAEEAGKKLKSIDVDMLWKEEDLKESRAYSKFKKEAATRSKDQQMHEAVRMIHNRLAEVSKILEYAQQMRAELSEGEQTLEYNHNTKKMFERINSKVVEIYSKTRQLK